VASVALQVGAAFAAGALSVTECGTEAERAKWAAMLAASGASAECGSPGGAPVLPVYSPPPASGWQQHPEWVDARSWTPFVLRWAADAAPWCRVPLSPRARVPYSRTRTVLLGILEAGDRRRAAGEVAVRPSRRPRHGGWGPVPYVATWGTRCGSDPPSSPNCGHTDTRCVRPPSRRTVPGGGLHRHRHCLWARERQSCPRPGPFPTEGPLCWLQSRSSRP